MNKFHAIVVIFSICLVTSVESGDGTTSAEQKKSGKSAEFIVQQNSQFRVYTNIPFLLLLPVRLGTGYSWMLYGETPELVVSNPSIRSPSNLQPGGAELQVFQVILKSTMPADLRFVLKRPVAPRSENVKEILVHLIPRN